MHFFQILSQILRYMRQPKKKASQDALAQSKWLCEAKDPKASASDTSVLNNLAADPTLKGDRTQQHLKRRKHIM